MLTRRHALMLGFGLPAALSTAIASPADEFWNKKKPEDWSEDEVAEMLTRSPWAKEASVSFYGGPNVGGGSRSSSGGMSRSNGRMSRTGTPGNAPSSVANPKYDAVVRWDSALPIRQALKKQPDPKAREYYIIALLGDVPNISQNADEEGQKETRLDALKANTKLERKGGPIFLMDYASLGKEGTLLYFPRNNGITSHDGTVTFSSKLGPVEVKCKFTLKEMMYQGNLEL